MVAALQTLRFGGDFSQAPVAAAAAAAAAASSSANSAPPGAALRVAARSGAKGSADGVQTPGSSPGGAASGDAAQQYENDIRNAQRARMYGDKAAFYAQKKQTLEGAARAEVQGLEDMNRGLAASHYGQISKDFTKDPKRAAVTQQGSTFAAHKKAVKGGEHAEKAHLAGIDQRHFEARAEYYQVRGEVDQAALARQLKLPTGERDSAEIARLQSRIQHAGVAQADRQGHAEQAREAAQARQPVGAVGLDKGGSDPGQGGSASGQGGSASGQGGSDPLVSPVQSERPARRGSQVTGTGL